MNDWTATLSAWSRKPAAQDAGLAVLLLSGTLAWLNEPYELSTWWLATGLCLIAVGVRRRWPAVALAAAVTGSISHMALMAGPAVADLAAPIVLFTIASQRSRRVSAAFLGAALLVATGWSLAVALDGRVDGWAVGQVLQPRDGTVAVPVEPGHPSAPVVSDLITRPLGPTDWGTLPLYGSLIAGWAIGASAQSRRAYLDELTARAGDLERERDQQAALAAAAERSRITRELHDVVAHGLSVIVMQAQGGAAAFERRPADTRAALDTIVETGRTSLADMRQILAAADPVAAATHPVPGLDRLPQLVAQVRDAGTPVRLRIEGRPRVLPTAVDLSSYRIIQEALTNTMKHSGPDASAEVIVRYGANRLTLEIADDGKAPPAYDGTGNGLRGMRERVALLRGEMSAAPGPRGGFVVRARLPIDQEAIDREPAG